MENIAEIITTTGSFMAVTITLLPLVIEFIYEKIASPKTSLWKSIWSWIIPIMIFYGVWVVGLLFEVGYLQEVTLWWIPLIHGVAAATMSNFGWTNIPWIKEFIVELLKTLPGESEKKPR